jgi:hypothetical protein
MIAFASPDESSIFAGFQARTVTDNHRGTLSGLAFPVTTA